jgi:adenine-specific DNA-methyltransferase
LEVLAIDTDPVATLLARAAFEVVGSRHACVLNTSYPGIDIPEIAGRTAFVGNPPYVRHHQLSAAAKSWAAGAGLALGHPASKLSGLHAHFFLETAQVARAGDVGCFVTSAEWLDVNYGAVIRDLLLGQLGGQSLHVLDPQAVPFEDAMTTAVVTCFSVGASPPSISARLVESSHSLGDLTGGVPVARAVLKTARRWTPLLRAPTGVSEAAADTVPLGTVARVHRGVVTGANDFFVLTRGRAAFLGLEQWCKPAISSAREILGARGVLRDTPDRKVLLDLPKQLDRRAHPRLDSYLRSGEESHEGKPPVCARYIPSHRTPWWCVGPTASPPVVSTYMARQAPVFALNPDGLALLNIGHGIYPASRWTEAELASLVGALNAAREGFRGGGRTYHGGLEKFEPGEMEALPVPAGKRKTA